MYKALAASAIQGADSKKVLIIGGVVVLSGVLLYLGIVNPLLKFLQIKDTREEKKGDKDEGKLSESQVLSPQLYRDNKELVSISSAKASRLATQLYEGRSFWGDDEAMGVGAITSAGSKINISYIAYQFNILYSKSMESYMDYLESEDWTQIRDYIRTIKKA